MKKQYLYLICAVCMAVIAYGGIKKCQEKGAVAPESEITAQKTEALAPAMESTAEITAEEPMDSAQQAYFERQYFEALTKMADGGKVYALDADGKRSPKAFTRFDDYEQFVAENTQYVRRRYSYDADGKPFEIEVTKTSVKGNVTDIEEKIEAVPAKSE